MGKTNRCQESGLQKNPSDKPFWWRKEPLKHISFLRVCKPKLWIVVGNKFKKKIETNLGSWHVFFCASSFSSSATMLHRDHRKTVTTNQRRKGNDDSSCSKRARRGEEGSTDCCRTAKHKTKKTDLASAGTPQKLFHLRKKAHCLCTRGCPNILLKGPPLSRRQE
jgi:hypothetical protein